MDFKVEDRVVLKKKALSIAYIASRNWYTSMYEGKSGKVIGKTAAGDKIAVEFDTKVFINGAQQSSHDNGCHGKGKLHYCWYIPVDCLELDTTTDEDLLLLLTN